MTSYNIFTGFRLDEKRRIFLLLVVTIVTLGINVAGILAGVTVVLAHFLYFPIILAAYWYPKRCYPFLLFIAAIYGSLIVYTNYPPDFILLTAAISRVVIFTTVGIVVSLLSSGLRRSEQQLNDIIEFLPDATFAVDREGFVIAWNRAMEDLTGIKKADIFKSGNYEYAIPFYGEKRPMLIDLALNEDPAIESYYPDLKKEPGRYTSDILIPDFKGQSGVYLHFSATALKDPSGSVTGAIESIRDVTDSVMTGSALSNTTRKLSTIAGIIRTDISGRLEIISGYLEAGEAEFTEPGVLSFIDHIRKETGGIRRRLDISRDFSDLGTAPPSWLLVRDEILKAAEKLEFGDAELRSWTERLEIFADPYLSSVFFHLFDNSLKFKGDLTRIIVTYRITDDMCHIFVEDDGPGIDYPDKETLFYRENEGVYGRGLYLSHEILSITGIEIRENGVPGRGARFELIVPAGGFRINMEPGDETDGKPADEIQEEHVPVARELKSGEFRKAEDIWKDYHNTRGDPGTDRIFGVFAGNRLMSVARCRRHRDGYEVDGVFTPEDYRRRGYSHLAVGALVEACHNDDLYMFSVTHLTGFYRKYGFVEIPLEELPEGIRERYSWAIGNLEGAGVQPMVRIHTDYTGNKYTGNKPERAQGKH